MRDKYKTMEGVTDDDIYMLKFFWETKEDITRYDKFEKMKPYLKKKHPEILDAFKKFRKAKKRMDSIIEKA